MTTQPDSEHAHATHNRKVIDTENLRHAGSGGVSARNSSAGFHPAFLDTRSGVVHLSRFADGRPAPCHLIQGLPPDLVLKGTGDGQSKIAGNCIAGFFLGGRFYTRDQAAKWMKDSGVAV